MTKIGDHNAAASNQLPVTLPPRFADSGQVLKAERTASVGGSNGLRPTLRMRGDGKSAEELKEAFTQFVGETFFGQMIKAMRSTVGKPVYFHGGRGEDVFQGRLDQQLAEHLTEASAAKFADPLFERQFPHFAERSQQNKLQELTQLRRQ